MRRAVIRTFPETGMELTYPLKIDGWKTNFPFGAWPIFFGGNIC